jgi:TRAP-type mannitol/chloroaromatic compound transport system permease small subunit
MTVREPATEPRRPLIDRTSGWAGQIASWSVLAMALLGGFNALARYFDGGLGTSLSSNRWVEGQWYLFSAVFLLGAADTLRQGAHVRVDVLFARLSPRCQAWIELLGGVFLLLPFCGFALWTAWPAVLESIRVRETSPDPQGLLRYPLKALVLVGFLLLALQGLSECSKALRSLRRPSSSGPGGFGSDAA